MASIPGTWRLYFSWGCSASYSSVNITFSAAGTYTTSEGLSGRWALIEGMLLRNYSSAPAVYAGNTAGNVIAGTMTTFGGLNGCWYMTKSTVAAAAKSKSATDSSGNKTAAKAAGKKSSKKR